MVESGTSIIHPARKGGVYRLLFIFVVLLLFGSGALRAAMQFDVFPGYDNTIPEASWFPVVCEVKNDGPTFMGIIEVSAGHLNDNQTERVMVELPTGTLKRLVIPVFSTARYQGSWNMRLLDERGRLREEHTITAQNGSIKQVAASTIIMGALPRSATGVPTIRQISVSETDLQPRAARITAALFPDNPLVLEGMDAIYLSSEKAVELNENQVNALLSWLNLGGHLIVSVEQISDVTATPWLRSVFPVDLSDMRTVSSHPELQDWVRQNLGSDSSSSRSGRRFKNQNPGTSPFAELPSDSDFEKASLQVATGKLHSGEALVTSADVPLMINSHQGRGCVTALMFSPEREPFRSWKNLPTFWARLARVPPVLYTSQNNNNYRGGGSIDGVFGAMIDSKQIRKLPVEWLLLLLIVYLVVIGPLDQYWLKRIKRPMLTWITFPCYVVMFSLLIYFIGYKLRAGETEWNELHLVDIIPTREGAELRGRTYASIYSPVNATYKVQSQERFSAFRGEFQSWTGVNQDGEHLAVQQDGDNFKAEIFVPVWTSQLYESDWWEPSTLPLKFSVTADDSGWSATIYNQRDRPVSNGRLVVANRIMEIGEIPPGQTKTYKFKKDQGISVSDFVHRYSTDFQNASQQRQHAFGGSTHIEDLSDSSMAVSFISSMGQDNNSRFVTPPGLDLSPLLEQGNAVLLAWESDYSPIKPMNMFPTRRSHKDTLWRVAVPINFTPAP